MDTQTLINMLFALCGALGGWVLKVLWGEIKDQQASCSALVTKVQEIEVLVSGEYVKRYDLQRMEDALRNQLNRIESTLSGKADR